MVTWYPDVAATWAMPFPIVPDPTTKIERISILSSSNYVIEGFLL
jgi:hypothetical protein